uniref:B30.2/SPRY domain-containing protein n=1 Tax=Monopterus albus TaxID=43700 RepID=A0A3Q3KRH0_MONAL|nr:SPRY domain-containing protein 4 [Monopterus albus]
MAVLVTAGRLCHLAGRTVTSLSARSRRAVSLPATRCYIFTSTRTNLQFRLDEQTAHSSLDLFKKDTGVIYRMLGLDPTHVQDNPERFRDWAVVFADEKISSGRHYWEVTVKKSQEFRLGVAEALMSRDDCVGTNSSSWVFGYAQRKWFAMTGNKVVPVMLVGKPDRVGILLDYEAGFLGLVDIEKPRIIHTIGAQFKAPLCPAFGLWDGELLTHSDLEEPEGLKQEEL